MAMTYLPTQRDDDEEPESAAAVWAFLLSLFVFKLATVILIFWHMQTWESGVILGSTLWYWFPPLLILGTGPALFYYRLRKVRARREALRRAELMISDETDVPTPSQERR
jgi:hypothetical protein